MHHPTLVALPTLPYPTYSQICSAQIRAANLRAEIDQIKAHLIRKTGTTDLNTLRLIINSLLQVIKDRISNHKVEIMARTNNHKAGITDRTNNHKAGIMAQMSSHCHPILNTNDRTQKVEISKGLDLLSPERKPDILKTSSMTVKVEIPRTAFNPMTNF